MYQLTKTSLALAAAALLLLTGCSGPAGGTSTGSSGVATAAAPAEPLDLTGEWKQTNSKSEDSYQSASIADGVITVNWVSEADSSTSLYWVGSYEAPTGSEDSYAWTSKGDTEQMAKALLASGDDAKDFSYENGVLSYEVSALGVTTTVKLERQ